MTPHPQSNVGLYGYPDPEPIWEPPLVDVTGHLDGYAVWVGNVRIKTFTNLTLASRFAEKLRGVIGASRDHALTTCRGASVADAPLQPQPDNEA